jgi:hypothetical protein
MWIGWAKTDVKMPWNYTPTGLSVGWKQKRPWKEDFEASTGIKIPIPRREVIKKK